jgi:hypothetical protein
MITILGKHLMRAPRSEQTRQFTHDASVHFAKGFFRGAIKTGAFFVVGLVALAGLHVYNESKIRTEVEIQRKKLEELRKFIENTKS